MSYKSNKTSVATVNQSTGAVTARKVGTAKVTVTAKDGSGKKAYVKIKVADAAEAPTVAPVYEEDNRAGVDIETFESYDVGYNWETEQAVTKGKEFKASNCGTMTVVQDPENPNNKCLRIQYNGDTQAYDYAPVIQAKAPVGKTLENYSGLRFQSRVISNDADCRYKNVYAYWAKKGTITSDYYFATTWTKPADATEQDVELRKFDVEKSMASGINTKFSVKDGTFANFFYNNKYFPMYFDAWQTSKVSGNRTVGYSETETTEATAVGWHQNSLNLDNTRINAADSTLLGERTLDLALGSTYAGAAKYVAGNYCTVYIDNIQYLEGDIAVTGMDATLTSDTIAVGLTAQIKPTFLPENTTQLAVTYVSSDPSVATVDSEGLITGVKAGTTTVSVTNNANPAFTKSFAITVIDRSLATSDRTLNLTGFTTKIPDGNEDTNIAKLGSDVQATVATAGISIPFTKSNQSVVIDLGESIDFTQYEGFSITGNMPEQISLEFYDSAFDKRYSIPDSGKTNTWGDAFAAFSWWEHYQWCSYPFYQGSRDARDADGNADKVKGKKGVVETQNFDWYSADNSMSDGTIKGSLKDVHYIVVKSNKDTAGDYNLQDITLRKDKATIKGASWPTK